MQIIITDYKYEKRLAKLAQEFDAALVNDCEEHSMKFENSFGFGTVAGINFDYGLNMMTFKMSPLRDLEFKFKLGRRHPILFLFTKDGEIQLSSDEQEGRHLLSSNESIIYAPKGDTNYSIYLQANKEVQFAFVGIVRFLFLSKIECDIDTIPTTLQDMFRDTTGTSSFFYKNSGNPKIANIISQMFLSTLTGLERKIEMEANTLKLTTEVIKSFRIENDAKASNFSFTKKDVQALNVAKKFILDNLDLTPDVKAISTLIGLNPNKIQKGFKLLFNKSLRQFIISAKMHQALQLLDERELSISEISYTINYVNKGHFSQLFKKEFGLLPSEYISYLKK